MCRILFYCNTPMLASGIKGMRIQLRFGSGLHGSAFMRRRLGCPVCLQRGAPPQFHLNLIFATISPPPPPNQPLNLLQVPKGRFTLLGRPVHWYLALFAHHQAAVGEEVEVWDDGAKIQAGFIDNLRFACPPTTYLQDI